MHRSPTTPFRPLVLAAVVALAMLALLAPGARAAGGPSAEALAGPGASVGSTTAPVQ